MAVGKARREWARAMQQLTALMAYASGVTPSACMSEKSESAIGQWLWLPHAAIVAVSAHKSGAWARHGREREVGQWPHACCAHETTFGVRPASCISRNTLSALSLCLSLPCATMASV